MSISRFQSFLPLAWQCRDFWNSEEPNRKVRDLRYQEFREFILKYAKNHALEPPICIRELLNLFVDNHSYLLYTEDQISAKTKIQARGRSFRVVFGSDGGEKDKDFRVRQFLQHLIDTNATFKYSYLVCSMFCNRDGLEVIKIQDFKCQQCSRFEQLLFISVISLISLATVEEQTSRKKRKSNSSSPTFLSKYSGKKYKNDGNASQRIGWAIQTVVIAWNQFALSLGFKDIEEMVMPYIYIDENYYMYKVIESRSNGFSPSSIMSQLSFGCITTNEKTETFSQAYDFSVSIDSILRHFTTIFLNDVYNIVQYDELYTASNGSDCNVIQNFISHGRRLASRFDSFSPQQVRQVVDVMKPDEMARRLTDNNEDSSESVQESSDANQSENVSRGESSSYDPTSMDPETFQVHLDNVKSAMKPYCRMYSCSYEDIVEVDEMKSDSDRCIGGETQLVLTDPPYNIRRRNKRNNSSYDVFTENDMIRTVETFSELLREGGHGLVFCSIEQLPLWKKHLRNHRENGKNGPTFTVDENPIHIIYSPRSYNGVPFTKSCTLQNATEYVVHFKKNGLRFKEEEKMVNYKCFNFVPSQFPAHRNVINNVPRVGKGESLRVRRDSRSVVLRAEQKSLPLLKELICRFSQPDDIVVDLFSGTFSTGIACIQLPEPRVFVGCEKDDDCFKQASSFVIKRFAEVLTRSQPHSFSVQEDAVKSAKLIQKHSRQRVAADPLWNAPINLPQFQSLPRHILQNIANQHHSIDLVQNCKGLPIENWDELYRGYLELSHPTELRNADGGHYGLCIAKSSIKHKKAGLGVFAMKTFAPGDIAGYFYGTFVYHDLRKRGTSKKTYGGSGILGVGVSDFQKYSIQLNVDGNDFKHVKDKFDSNPFCCLTPASFCISRYINDYRYHEEDEEFEAVEKKEIPQRVQNVKFQMEKPVEKSSELVSYQLFKIEVIKPINPKEELFISYGPGVSIIRQVVDNDISD